MTYMVSSPANSKGKAIKNEVLLGIEWQRVER
jgi:hypothetical protein